MNSVSKPNQILTVVIRGRKLVKRDSPSRFATFPQRLCERLGIDPGDLVEIQIRKITKPGENRS